MNNEPLDEFKLEDNEIKNKGTTNQNILNSDLLLLLVILFIFLVIPISLANSLSS